MFEIVLKYLSEHWPLLTTIFVIIVGAIFITWKIAKQYFHLTHRLGKTEDDCKKIDGHIMPKLTTINDSITSLNISFNGLIVHLGAKDQLFPTNLFVSKSPMQLTALGIQILDTIGGKVYIDEHAEYLIKEMDAIGVKTALDSQTISPLVINKVSQEHTFTAIKNYLFKNPIYRTNTPEGTAIEVVLDMGTVSNIMGIYLRDKYLAKHPELNPEDIK